MQLPWRFVPAHHGRDSVLDAKHLKRHFHSFGVEHPDHRGVARPESNREIERFRIEAPLRLSTGVGKINCRVDDAAERGGVGVEGHDSQTVCGGRRHTVCEVRRRARRERFRDLSGASEPNHVLVVNRVDAAAADAVVRMILNQRLPRVPQLAVRVPVAAYPGERR